MFRRYKPRLVRYFNWSANLAYVVGLIATDGNLSGNGRHITFTSKDIELIGYVKIILESKGRIGFTRNKKSEVYRINICNVQLHDWFMNIGLTPKKSLTIKKLDVPDRYFADFLRGHLDGDGSITTYIDTYNNYKKPSYVYRRLWLRFISASQKHATWIKERVRVLFEINGQIHATKENPSGNRMYIIKFGKKSSLNLLSKIYYKKDLPCLTRKKSIYFDFLAKI